VVGEEGLMLTMLGETTTVHWDQIVGLEREPFPDGAEGMTLYTLDAFQLAFASAWFRRGAEAFTQIRSAVPERLQSFTTEGVDTQEAG
jgi:hypothetical protein